MLDVGFGGLVEHGGCVGVERLEAVPGEPHGPVAGLGGFVDALQNAQKKLVPKAITLPVMTTGATDSAFLRVTGVQAYGIGVPSTEADSRTVHGNDERTDVKMLGLFVQYEWSAVTEVAAK